MFCPTSLEDIRVHRCSEKPDVIGRGRHNIVVNMGRTAPISSRTAFIELHLVVHMKADIKSCVKNKKELKGEVHTVAALTSA